MSQKGLSAEVKEQVEKIVATLSREAIKDPNIYYLARYRGNHVYLDRVNYGRQGPICRLTYRGRLDNWDFAIYKYSSGRYDAEEWLFPGSGQVEGTVEGAMRAGLKAYPP